MPSSRIPSPARSQGVRSTPRRYNPRASRSVGSPARSNTSVKLSAMIQMETFALSPMPSRRSVLTDTSEIDVPTRKSWWKKLDENSRDIMDVINTKGPIEGNIAIEEYIEIDVLSQEKQKKNYTLDLPESSDGESISSIVIPQRKLFTQKESNPQKKFGQIIDNRESLAKLNKTQGDDEKIFNVGRKDLFNQGTKLRNKPLFPSALLNISPNKTAANKTKELATASVKGQVKSLFGNCGGIKRKNMFADFIVSESEDEIPEIQPKVFGFQKKVDERRRPSLKSRDVREGHLYSPSNMTDIEIDNWRLLPSSTMIDHQLEDALIRTTPSKKARLSKLSEAVKESFNSDRNKTANKSKTTNKSLNSKSKSKNLSKLKNTDNNESINVETENNVSNTTSDKLKKNQTSDIVEKTIKDTSRDRSLKKVTSKNKQHNKSKAAQLSKTGDKIISDSHLQDKNSSKQHKQNKNKNVKKHSERNQMSDDEDFTLVYENDDQDRENEPNDPESVYENELEKPMKMSNVLLTTENLKQNKSKSRNFINQNNEDEEDEKSVCIEDENENVSENMQMDTSDNYNRNKSQLEMTIIQENGNKENHQNQFTDQAEDELDNNKQIEQDIEEDMIYEEEELINHPEENEKKERDIEMEFSKNHLQKDDDNTESNKYTNKADEIRIQSKTSKLNKSQDRDKHDPKQTGKKTKHLETNQVNVDGQNEVINETISYEKKDETQDIYDMKNKTNETANHVEAIERRVSTDRSKYIQEKVPSPEACRKHNKTSQMESFTVEGRNTSARKTKSNIKNLTIRPSLAPVRESTGVSDATQNSSAEGSGWDSHRTTRATLRQTFGKDFTLRKSLRALVMEKSAKRQTNVIEMNAHISRFPQANSTELHMSEQFNLDKEDVAQKISESDNLVSPESKNSSHQEFSEQVKSLNGEKNFESDEEKKINESNGEGSDEIDESEKEQNSSHFADGESDNAEENNESNNEVSLDVDEADDDQEIELDDDQEMNESVHEVSRHDDNADNSQEVNESDDAQEINESNQEVTHDSDEAEDVQENNESEDAEELIKSSHEVSRDIEEADDDQENNVSEDDPELVESGHEVSHDNDDDKADEDEENNESEDDPELVESGHEVSRDNDDDDEADEDKENNESEDVQELNESDHEVSKASNREESRKVNQTTMEMYLQKVKSRKLERKNQLVNDIMNTLKAPPRDILNPFKVPAVPKLRRMRAQHIKPKAKPLKQSVFTTDMLPPEILEDMKYKPPKRYRPANASWITNRLYKFLESKLQPKHDYKARVRSEKLVETIYNFTKDIRRHTTAPPDAVDALKLEMARLDVVKTHVEFYEFFHEYMPREVRVKVVPDLFNKISLPKRGVFSDILR